MTRKPTFGTSTLLPRVFKAFTLGKTLDDYLEDDMLRAAVERKFGVIGEALSQLLRLFPHYRTSLTLPEQVIAFSDQIIHGYATVRDDIVWEIVTVYFPRLKSEVVALLDRPEA